jgi:hypothetical protein
MGILKKFNEFLETPNMENTEGEDKMMNSPEELKMALDKLSKEGGEVEFNQYKISIPSELNGEGESKTTYLIDKGGKHAQAQSEEEVEKIVTEQVVFESYRHRKHRK